jgi:2-oxoglutarate dehydrogenase E2 component (dihydrolipoamide succinyltransferase)
MGIQVKVPTVGESITEVTIANWLKKNGETVKADEIIAELESEKATFELTAPEAGVLKIVRQQGDTVPIGEVICEVESNGQATQPKAEAKAQPAPAPAQASKPTGGVKEMKVPAVGESITEVTISQWLKKDGDLVRIDEILAEVESDKATFELPAEATGILRIVAKEKDTLPIGGLICRIEITDAAAAPSPKAATPAEAPTDKSYAAGHPSPAAAKILDEKGVAANQVQGSGVGGRITKDDAQKAQPTPAGKPADAKPQPAAASGPPVISDGTSRNERREKMTSLRKTIAKRLVAVKNETAMLTTFNEVDMKPVMDLRSKYKDQFKEKYGVGLGFMSFFTKAVCVALKDFPAVNASIDKDEIIYHDYLHPEVSLFL